MPNALTGGPNTATTDIFPSAAGRKTGVLLSVILPCRNEVQAIEPCIKSILAQEGLTENFEIIVADGLSEDGTRMILERLAATDSRLRVVSNPDRIVSCGLNAALRQARGEIIIRLDAHTEYAPDYLQQCLQVLQATGADNVGGPWVARGKGLVSEAIAAAFQSPFAVGGARGHNPHYEGWVETVYLGCWRREAFQRFGDFDEELVRNQDDEHNLRISRAGGKIWQSPKIKSWYCPRRSLSALFKQYMQYGYWKVRVIQKHKLPASPRHLVPGAFLLTLSLLAFTTMLGYLVAGVWPLAALFRSLTCGLLEGLLGLYSACVFGASLVTAARTSWKLLPVLPAVFACYHFGYGYGFLRGIGDFALRRQHPRPGFARLTR